MKERKKDWKRKRKEEWRKEEKKKKKEKKKRERNLSSKLKGGSRDPLIENSPNHYISNFTNLRLNFAILPKNGKRVSNIA